MMSELELDDVPPDSTVVVTVETPEGDVEELVLVRVDGGVRAYVNRCQHWTDVRLDDGDGAYLRNGEMVCEKHGAMFRVSDGECTIGPCEGATLPSVSTSVDGDLVSLDEGYTVLGLGSAEDGAENELGSRGGDDF